MQKPIKLRGLTLIEFVIVIVLVAILAATAMMRTPGDQVVTAAQAQSLMEDIRHTQILSMTNNTRYRMDFTSTSQYRILNSAGAPMIIPSTGTTVAVFPTAISRSLNFSSQYLIFDATGTPYTGTIETDTGTILASNYIITLTGRDSSKQVIVSPSTGGVMVQ